MLGILNNILFYVFKLVETGPLGIEDDGEEAPAPLVVVNVSITRNFVGTNGLRFSPLMIDFDNNYEISFYRPLLL